MEYPGVRLGQRGGLFDLYQYYLGGGDQSDDGPVTTDPFPGAGGREDSGGAGIDPFAERTVRTYLPRDERGFQIQPGSGVFTRQYQPDNFGVDRNIATFGDAGKPILSGFTEEEEDPGRITTFFDRLKSGIGSINLGNFPSVMRGGAMFLSALTGRPADAIYSYGGDTMGVGSRAGLTRDEVRNMEYLEDFGGVNEYGQDIYGKNVVSGFGNYEQSVRDSIEQIEQTLLNAQKKYGGLTDKYYDQTKLIRQKLEDYKGFINKVEADDEKEEEQIKTKNLMTEFYDIKKQEAGANIVDEVALTSGGGGANIVDEVALTSGGGGANIVDEVALTSGGGGGNGGASYDSGTAGTSAGKSTSRGRKDGGWGWKDGGLVRKPYGDGGIVDLL